MSETMSLQFTDNPVTRGREGQYIELQVDARRIMESWRASLFSFEWLLPDGRIRSVGELPQREQPKRSEIEHRLETGESLEKPVLGIGMFDNVEIGSGRATFLTLAAHGVRTIPVHVPTAQCDEFSGFAVQPG